MILNVDTAFLLRGAELMRLSVIQGSKCNKRVFIDGEIIKLYAKLSEGLYKSPHDNELKLCIFEIDLQNNGTVFSCIESSNTIVLVVCGTSWLFDVDVCYNEMIPIDKK